MESTIDMQLCPKRTPGIEIRAVPEGFVVYDPRNDRLHYLNATAAVVLEACDGSIRADELAPLLAATFALNDPPTDEVKLCLARLWSEGLLLPSSA